MGTYCLTGIEFQFYKMKRVLEMDGGDGDAGVTGMVVASS